jgi:thiol-disulfide isomerase/thioredoxin
MLKFLLSLCIAISLSSISAQENEVKVIGEFAQLEKDYFDVRDGKVHLINFWATWCKPCVKELPYIDALTEKYGDDIKVTLVSLDFPRMIETKLIPFLDKHQLKSEVVLLEDGKVNEWIDMVDPNWSGAIPATVLFKDGIKHFYETEFHSAEEVEAIITKINNQKN